MPLQHREQARLLMQSPDPEVQAKGRAPIEPGEAPSKDARGKRVGILPARKA